MRSFLFIVFALLAAGFLIPAGGQQQRSRRAAAVAGSGSKDSLQKPGKFGVTLGSKPLPVGMNKRSFDSVANLRLTPAEAGAVVTEFLFTYGENRLYEDSVGNPMWMMDLMREYCTGDVINSNLKEFLPGHSKPGDSVWFENIRVKRRDGTVYRAQPLTFFIRR